MKAVKYKGEKRATPYDGQKRREQPELPPTRMSIDGEASSPEVRTLGRSLALRNGIQTLQDIFDDTREMLHFEQMLLGRNVIGRVTCVDGSLELGNDFAAVTHLGHPVNGHARLGFAGSLDGFVYMVAIHSLATELGKQCGMNVDDAPRIGFYQKRRNHQQESGKDNEVDSVFLQQRQQPTGIGKRLSRHHGRRHSVTFGTLQREGIGTVAHHKSRLHRRISLKMADDIFTVGAAARHENGKMGYHIKNMLERK